MITWYLNPNTVLGNSRIKLLGIHNRIAHDWPYSVSIRGVSHEGRVYYNPPPHTLRILSVSRYFLRLIVPNINRASHFNFHAIKRRCE